MSTTDGVRQVDTARWTKTGQVFTTPDDSALAANESRIVIFRTPTGVSEATSIDAAGAIDFEDSVVVGIENYFQTSLQAGRYSQIKVCAGQNVLSAELTDQKNNHLANDGIKVNLQPKRTYYYQVSHVEKGVTPVIRAINAPEAIELLKGSIEQTHQISRVVTDNCMQPPTQTTTTNPVTTPVMETQKPINLDVLFDFDSAQIKGKYQQKIQLLAEYMQANPEATVHLESHTDNKGAAGYNLKLSQARAEAVKAELVNNYEVAGNRITTQGYGESQPVASNDTEAGRQQNRRVLATITP
ncbi:OmpA family protein [Psychrobacter sanguinis]|uniref:OmpA family protein n=1 Tax=Psychrobacter sanguinis TaxID=861445 RepID=UPI001396A5B6